MKRGVCTRRVGVLWLSKAEEPEQLTLQRRLPVSRRRPSARLCSARRGAWQARAAPLRSAPLGSAPQRARHSRAPIAAWLAILPPEPASPPAASALTQAQQPGGQRAAGSGRGRQDGSGQRGPHREGAAARLPQAAPGPREHHGLRPPHR